MRLRHSSRDFHLFHSLRSATLYSFLSFTSYCFIFHLIICWLFFFFFFCLSLYKNTFFNWWLFVYAFSRRILVDPLTESMIESMNMQKNCVFCCCWVFGIHRNKLNISEHFGELFLSKFYTVVYTTKVRFFIISWCSPYALEFRKHFSNY